jgi:hypothetical protein
MVFDFLRHDSHQLLVINWRPWIWVNVGSLVQKTVMKIIDKHKAVIEKEKNRKSKYQKPKNNSISEQTKVEMDDDTKQLLKELEDVGASFQDT